MTDEAGAGRGSRSKDDGEGAGLGEPSPVIQLDDHRRAPPAGGTAGRAIRVLIVDDNEDDFLLARELLARAGQDRYRVEHAPDAEAALAQLLSGQHDVGLVDYRLPGQDGLSLVRLAARRGVRAPMILLSGLAVPDLELEAIEAGAADFVDKEEFDVERLDRAIRLALARQRRGSPHEHTAQIDGLTGLPGRALFRDRLERAAARVRRQHGLAAVILIELDRLGAAGERFGDAAADSLLRLTAERLIRSLREIDTVARLRRATFGLAVENLGRPEDAALVARKLLDAVSAPVMIEGATVSLTASMGAVLASPEASDPARLEACAEAALDRARAMGGNRCCFDDERLEAEARQRALLAHDLQRAIEADALVLQFQPQVTLCSAELGLSAHAGWRHDTLGVIEGERLHATAEAAGLVEPLADWLTAAACRQARRWQEDGLPQLHIAVPLLSRRPLAWSGIARRLEIHLAATGIPPDRLELEIDEPLLLAEVQAGGRALHEARALGVRIAAGGFGSGPAALAILRDAPLTTVKLARAMLQGTPEDDRQGRILEAVIDLSRQLQLRLVAEGIESRAQLQLLKAQGCDAVQSLISCPPLPADACTGWLRQAAHRA
jgi:diguanylate cyclase (GGDEF)-like protein